MKYGMASGLLMWVGWMGVVVLWAQRTGAATQYAHAGAVGYWLVSALWLGFSAFATSAVFVAIKTFVSPLLLKPPPPPSGN
jgi:hypothetical protein